MLKIEYRTYEIVCFFRECAKFYKWVHLRIDIGYSVLYPIFIKMQLMFCLRVWKINYKRKKSNVCDFEREKCNGNKITDPLYCCEIDLRWMLCFEYIPNVGNEERERARWKGWYSAYTL